MLGILIGLLIAALVVAVVTWPFLRKRHGEPAAAPARLSERARLRRARQDVYEQIRQLQADRGSGLATDDDYAGYLRELRIAAAELMRSEQALPDELSTEEKLELEIEKARASDRAREGDSD